MGGLGNAFRLFYEEAKFPRRDSKARGSLGDIEGEHEREQQEGEQDQVRLIFGSLVGQCFFSSSVLTPLL